MECSLFGAGCVIVKDFVFSSDLRAGSQFNTL